MAKLAGRTCVFLLFFEINEVSVKRMFFLIGDGESFSPLEGVSRGKKFDKKMRLAESEAPRILMEFS